LAKASGLPANLQASLLGRRPDVVAARLRAEAAAERIDVARAQFYPNVNLAAFIGVQSLGTEYVVEIRFSPGNVGPAITLPIFEGGRLQGQYKGARAEYDAAVASYNGVVTQAFTTSPMWRSASARLPGVSKERKRLSMPLLKPTGSCRTVIAAAWPLISKCSMPKTRSWPMSRRWPTCAHACSLS
jgi:hypothetical protein